MITITVLTDSGELVCPHEDGTTLIHTLQANRIGVGAPCGGIGRCGKCLVSLDNCGAAGPVYNASLESSGDGPGKRLACRSVPTGDLTVDVRGQSVTTDNSVDSKGGTFHLPPDGHAIAVSIPVSLPAPSLDDQRSVHQRITDDLDGPVEVSLRAIARAQQIIAQGGTDAAALCVSQKMGAVVMEIDQDVRDKILAVAFDIGTTTVAGYLLELASRRIIAAVSEENRQKQFGADVVSRITAAHDGKDLTRVIREQLARLVEALCKAGAIGPEQIVAATVVGNPTMIHLLYGLDPWPIGQAPFMPVSTDRLSLPMEELALPGHPAARMDCAPAVSAYVGADITADLISVAGAGPDVNFLLVDVGTNGEMALSFKGKVFACSTAAGPAFEGANIRCGAGGIPGAINSVARDGDTLTIGTIGDQPPRAICGPGLIDTLACFLEDGIVDETGRMDEKKAAESAVYRDRVTTVDGDVAIILSKDDSGGEIVVTQSDVRQVQLAKGAIAAGVRTLLDEAGVQVSELDHVYLAGGFGTYVNPRSAERIGLITGGDIVESIGNAAGAGAARLLVDQSGWELARMIAENGNYIELSSSARFQEYFVEEMMFPE